MCSFFCGLLGLILSILGLNQIRNSGGTLGGRGFAIAGIIISCLLGVVGVLAAVAIPAFMDYMSKSKLVEAPLQLHKLERNAKRYVVEHNEFPHGSVALTPATPCCAGTGHKCAEPEAWLAPVWKELDFAIDEPHAFQYSYESDGQTLTARAIGDVSCNGHAMTYELKGVITNGLPTFTTSGPTIN